MVVVMGISGVGKSAVGGVLATQLEVPYSDGDDHHPASNIAKMAAGRPLNDDDRRPWLRRIGQWLVDHESTGGVISCSALRRAHRDVLVSHAPRVVFLHLVGERELILARMQEREHFMPPALLASQEATLEPLEPDERGVVLDITDAPDRIVDRFLAKARTLFRC